MSTEDLEHRLLLVLAGIALGVLALFCLLSYTVLRPWFARSTPPPVTRVTASRTPYHPQPDATRTPRPTPLPTVDSTSEPPEEASISEVTGYAQISTLDCEARSAVDWAAFFGVQIDEYEFIDTLPASDNPERGFVGVYWGKQGGLPPNSYGVHAPPVAAVLRRYGMQAYDWKNLDWRSLQREIAAGRPVIAWVVGNVFSTGSRETYIAEDGQAVNVARFEHTVIVVGYDTQDVTVVDGNMVYTRGLETFLDSWAVLDNMAITAADIRNN